MHSPFFSIEGRVQWFPAYSLFNIWPSAYLWFFFLGMYLMSPCGGIYGHFSNWFFCKGPQKKNTFFTHSNYEEYGRYRVGQEVRACSTDYQCTPIGIFMTHIHYLDFFRYSHTLSLLWMSRDGCTALKLQEFATRPLSAEESDTYVPSYLRYNQPNYLATACWIDNTLEV